MKKRKAKYEYQTRREYKTKQLFIVIIAIISCLSIIAIFARYIFNSSNDFFLRSKEFYFYSDKLRDTNPYYQIDNWSGVDDYTIIINMNSYDNNLKTTSYDISYDVSYQCSSNVVCQLNKTSGTIPTTTHTDYFNLTLTPNTTLNTGDSVWVKITANSTSEYQKTISGEFKLVVGKEKLTYDIKDSANSPYLEVNLTNTLTYYTISEAFNSYAIGNKIDMDTYLALSEANKKKCYSALVTLQFNPAQIILDMTNTNYLNATNVTTTNINGTDYISQITFKVDAVSSAMVRFYKLDVSQNYTYPIVNTTPIVTVTSV